MVGGRCSNDRVGGVNQLAACNGCGCRRPGTGGDMADGINFESRDYLVKVVGMLQQNSALVVEFPEQREATLYFVMIRAEQSTSSRS